jgi:hypothetical protein
MKLIRKIITPFSIAKVYGNGTVKIKKGIITERVNIRLIKPYYE